MPPIPSFPPRAVSLVHPDSIKRKPRFASLPRKFSPTCRPVPAQNALFPRRPGMRWIARGAPRGLPAPGMAKKSVYLGSLPGTRSREEKGGFWKLRPSPSKGNRQKTCHVPAGSRRSSWRGGTNRLNLARYGTRPPARGTKWRGFMRIRALCPRISARRGPKRDGHPRDRGPRTGEPSRLAAIGRALRRYGATAVDGRSSAAPASSMNRRPSSGAQLPCRGSKPGPQRNSASVAAPSFRSQTGTVEQFSPPPTAKDSAQMGERPSFIGATPVDRHPYHAVVGYGRV